MRMYGWVLMLWLTFITFVNADNKSREHEIAKARSLLKNALTGEGREMFSNVLEVFKEVLDNKEDLETEPDVKQDSIKKESKTPKIMEEKRKIVDPKRVSPCLQKSTMVALTTQRYSGNKGHMRNEPVVVSPSTSKLNSYTYKFNRSRKLPASMFLTLGPNVQEPQQITTSPTKLQLKPRDVSRGDRHSDMLIAYDNAEWVPHDTYYRRNQFASDSPMQLAEKQRRLFMATGSKHMRRVGMPQERYRQFEVKRRRPKIPNKIVIRDPSEADYVRWKTESTPEKLEKMKQYMKTMSNESITSSKQEMYDWESILLLASERNVQVEKQKYPEQEEYDEYDVAASFSDYGNRSSRYEDFSVIESDMRYRMPFVVVILRYQVVKCGGTLISARHVLTAAHCFTQGKALESPSIFSVRAGSLSWRKGGQWVQVSKFNIHPDFFKFSNAQPTYLHDLALVFLKKAVITGDTVDFIDISPPNMGPELYLATKRKDICRTVSYRGLNAIMSPQHDSSIDVSDVWASQVPLIDFEECRHLLVSRGFTLDDESQICTTCTEGICSGEEGAGLFCRIQGVEVIVGVLSYGTGCGSSCRPSVYSRTDIGRVFIADSMKTADRKYYRSTVDKGTTTTKAVIWFTLFTVIWMT